MATTSDELRPTSWRAVAAVALGGALGAPARYAVTELVHVAPETFPWATFWINVSGSLLLGCLLALIVDGRLTSAYGRPFLASGMLGAFTTFSTLAIEVDLLVRAGHAGIAASYAASSVVAGVAAAHGGMMLARRRRATA